MSIDLSYQLKMLFSCVDTKHDIFNYLESKKYTSKNCKINDVYDSELYKKINAYDETYYITYNYSTDGAPLTKSGKRGFWPL